MTDLGPKNADEFIEQQLDELLLTLEEEFDADVLCLVGDLIAGIDDRVRDMAEHLRRQNPSRSRLVVILTTEGGLIEIVERIVKTLRYHYHHVGFLVPNYGLFGGHGPCAVGR